MLKEEIVKTLKGTFPDEQHGEAIGHAADAVVEIVFKAISGAIGIAIAAYDAQKIKQEGYSTHE